MNTPTWPTAPQPMNADATWWDAISAVAYHAMEKPLFSEVTRTVINMGGDVTDFDFNRKKGCFRFVDPKGEEHSMIMHPSPASRSSARQKIVEICQCTPAA